MEYRELVDHIAEQAAAMRAAVVKAGPDATVPTCPEWTVRQLVRHMARVHQWAGKCLRTNPDGPSPRREEPPTDWDELLSWWDAEFGTLHEYLLAGGPERPAWVFFPSEPHNARFWARRQAHETAIHRLDAEHALAGPDQALPSLIFDPELAADGVDEALRIVIPGRLSQDPASLSGTVLFHAADAGQAWLTHVRAGEPPETGPAEPGVDADASVVGTADAVYRAAWHRPSTAILGGDSALLAELRTP